MQRFQMEKLKEVDQLKSRFFANISHEFRTPLSLIEGPLKQLTAGESPRDAKSTYEMMLRNTQRLTRLVNQLLELSKFESGQMKLRASEMDIVEVVKGVVASFESLAARKGIRFTSSGLDAPIMGWFDKDLIEKILTNLLSNAFKFTGSEGKVDVTVARERLSIQISVADSGIGIPAAELDKVFDRFYQVDASQTREQEGTGIGLALAKELVELHKGQIFLTSEVGKGSTFTMHLPLGKDHLRVEEIVMSEDSRTIKVTTESNEGEAFQGQGEEIDEESDAESHPSVEVEFTSRRFSVPTVLDCSKCGMLESLITSLAIKLAMRRQQMKRRGRNTRLRC